MDLNEDDARLPMSYDMLLTRRLTIDYISYKLTQRGYEWRTCPELLPPNPLCLLMRSKGDQLEEQYRTVFDEMTTELHITPTSAYPTFVGVTNELFREGVQWGRVVALFVFGGTLAVQCVHNEIPHLVDAIVEWVYKYVEENLAQWIHVHGGWEGFMMFFGRNMEAPLLDFAWPSLKNFFCGVAAGAIGALTIGAILTRQDLR